VIVLEWWRGLDYGTQVTGLCVAGAFWLVLVASFARDMWRIFRG
jgi:hypothetical protein